MVAIMFRPAEAIPKQHEQQQDGGRLPHDPPLADSDGVYIVVLLMCCCEETDAGSSGSGSAGGPDDGMSRHLGMMLRKGRPSFVEVLR